MRPRHLQPAHLRFLVFAAALFLAAPAAQALTFETQNYTDDSYLRYSNPDKKVEQFTDGKLQTPGPGGTTFRLEAGPSNSLGGPFSSRFGTFRQFSPAWGPQAFPDSR